MDWTGSVATANATAVSPSIPLTIYHLDALAITAGNAGTPAVDTVCAYLEWSTDQPAAIVQQPLSVAQSTPAGAPFPAGSSLKATAYNSLGQPVQLGEVRQYVMDAFGLAVYAGPSGAASFRSEYVTHLRTSGGMMVSGNTALQRHARATNLQQPSIHFVTLLLGPAPRVHLDCRRTRLVTPSHRTKA